MQPTDKVPLLGRVKSLISNQKRPEAKDGSETSSGGMKVVLEASLAYDTAAVLTF